MWMSYLSGFLPVSLDSFCLAWTLFFRRLMLDFERRKDFPPPSFRTRHCSVILYSCSHKIIKLLPYNSLPSAWSANAKFWSFNSGITLTFLKDQILALGEWFCMSGCSGTFFSTPPVFLAFFLGASRRELLCGLPGFGSRKRWWFWSPKRLGL